MSLIVILKFKLGTKNDSQTSVHLIFSFAEDIPAMGGDVTILVLLMKFVTAKARIPLLGLTPKIQIAYLSGNAVLPDANSCFHILKLPTKHGDNYKDFVEAMKTALRHGCCFFGEV